MKEDLGKKEKGTNWRKLKEKIIEAMPWKEIKIREKYKTEEDFWNVECHERKISLKMDQRSIREGRMSEAEGKEKGI